MAPGVLFESAPVHYGPRPSRIGRSSSSTSIMPLYKLQMSSVQPSPLSGHVWIITGPAGCGKSTLAKKIADRLQMPYIEGDEFHPPANVKKMANNIPLTDADRWGWLTTLRKEAISQLEKLSKSSNSAAKDAPERGVVMTCSALKRKYRELLRGRTAVTPGGSSNIISPEFPNVQVHFIYLRAPEDVLMARVMARKGHYMKESMVRSQFKTLEEPDEAVEHDVICIDVGEGHPPDEVGKSAISIVRRYMDLDEQ